MACALIIWPIMLWRLLVLMYPGLHPILLLIHLCLSQQNSCHYYQSHSTSELTEKIKLGPKLTQLSVLYTSWMKNM